MRSKRKTGRSKRPGPPAQEKRAANQAGNRAGDLAANQAGNRAANQAAKPAGPGPKLTAADWLSFFIIAGLAVGVRIAYTLASRQSPFFDHLDLDSRFYDLWAREIAAGDWIGTKVFFMGPLYPYFLAVLYKIAGPGLLSVKIVQGVLGGMTAGLTFLLGREIFGKVAGLIAGFMAALYVPFIFYDSSLLFPVLATFLNTAMLYFLYRGVLRGGEGNYLFAGLLAGLSATGNASVLAFGPLAVLFILLHGKASARRRLRKAALFVIGVAVIVTPITVRNAVLGKDFVPLTSNAGLNLFIGNNERSTGAYVKPLELDVYEDPEGEVIAEAALGRELKPSEVSAYWRGRALEYMRANPGAFTSNLLRKAFYFWSVYEVPQIEHLPFEKRYSWLLRIPSPSFGMICPLGILGVVLALRKRKEAWLLLLFMLAYSSTIVVFFVVARYRLPMIPALMVFASYTVWWWIRALSGRRYRDLLVSLGVLVSLYVLVHVNFYRIDPRSGFAQSHYRLGTIQEKKGRFDRALASYLKAVELDPKMASAHVNLGILRSRMQRFEGAEASLKRAVALDPDYAKAYYNLGLVYAEQAKNDSALASLDRALELKQDYHLASLARAGVYYEMAFFDIAEPILLSLRDIASVSAQSRQQAEALLRIIPERRTWTGGRRTQAMKLSDSHLLRGDNLLALGLTDRALAAYLEAAGADPGAAVAMHQAGTIYLNRGDTATALRLFTDAARAAPALEGVHFALGVMAFRGGDMRRACREFEEELRIDPSSSASHINLAMCYEEHLNDPGRAAYHMERYIELTGGTPELREHLKKLRETVNESE
jgi:tetratricopeptide (TPR) repeat protein